MKPFPLLNKKSVSAMEYINTDIDGVVILKPQVHEDARGYFMETFVQNDFDRHVRPVKFVQDNESRSTFGVLRGLHFQRMPHTQSKLVRCINGRVLDVAVDLRYGSPTFGKHVSVELSEENHLQLFIPRGFAHGFVVLSPEATFAYKCDALYSPQSEGGINPFDPALGIDWHISKEDAILSDKDEARPCLGEVIDSVTFKGSLYE